MLARRHAQKLDRQRRIIKAARRLFAARGFPQTAMEDIAQHAELAVGTLYNYFPSKTELLLAIIRRETDQMVEAGQRLIESRPADPLQALTALLEIYVQGFAGDDRKLWRELIGAAIASPAILAPRVFESDLRQLAQIGALLETLHGRGALRAGLDLPRAATAIYGLSLTWAMAFVMDESMTVETLRDEVRRGVEIVTRGLLESVARN